MLDILITKLMIWRIKKGYGANCIGVDYENFEDGYRDINHPGRCSGCCAKQVIEWLENHIKLMKL